METQLTDWLTIDHSAMILVDQQTGIFNGVADTHDERETCCKD